MTSNEQDDRESAAANRLLPPWSSPIFSTSTSTHFDRTYSPSSTIPFSWEHQPGVPKFHEKTLNPHPDPLLLPLPPPLRSPFTQPSKKTPTRFLKLTSNSADPFTAALAQCAADQPRTAAVARRRRAPVWVGLLAGGYGSCKTCAVAESPVRTGTRPAGYRVLNRPHS